MTLRMSQSKIVSVGLLIGAVMVCSCSRERLHAIPTTDSGTLTFHSILVYDQHGNNAGEIARESAQTYLLSKKLFDEKIDAAIDSMKDTDFYYPYLIYMKVKMGSLTPEQNIQWLNRARSAKAADKWPMLRFMINLQLFADFADQQRHHEALDALAEIKKNYHELELYEKADVNPIMKMLDNAVTGQHVNISAELRARLNDDACFVEKYSQYHSCLLTDPTAKALLSVLSRDASETDSGND